MKQTSLIRRKAWDVLFVIGTCGMDEVRKLMDRGVLAGDLEQVWNEWADNEIWFERNWMQFKVQHRDVVLVSAQSWPWHGSSARFIGNYHYAELCTDGPEKGWNKKAVAAARRIVKQGAAEKLFVYLSPSVEVPWAEMAKFAADVDELVAITSVRSPGGGSEVPWLWAQRGTEDDIPFSDPLVEDSVLPPMMPPGLIMGEMVSVVVDDGPSPEPPVADRGQVNFTVYVSGDLSDEGKDDSDESVTEVMETEHLEEE